MTEHTIEAHEDYLRALRTGKPQYPVGAIAVAGFYKARYPGKDSPWCAVKITERYGQDPETGEQSSDSIFDVTVNGRPVAPTEVWPNCGRFPISLEDYKTMTMTNGTGGYAPVSNGAIPAAAIIPQFQIAQPERMQSEQINELAAALAKAQGALKPAIKDNTANAGQYKYTYADLASVWAVCREALATNGLAVAQTTGPSDGTMVTVITTLMHSSGQWLRGSITMRSMKSDPQGIGSILTYCRRYALAAMVGVAFEDEDDDANSASDKKVEVTKKSARVDEAQQKAAEFANGLMSEIDAIKTTGFLVELMATPRNKAGMAKLEVEYPDLFQQVQNVRQRKASALLPKVKEPA